MNRPIDYICSICHRETDDPVVIGHVERMSGPPFTRIACPDCAPPPDTEVPPEKGPKYPDGN
ncbi:hypothetical protein [Streptomyces sp. AK02-01A]|uniref:hypothetical protein n=1 Tax=Streptomyces sp. AK02-01A TaxID=3028648 RepID=UPI0029B4422C|nr:hypothetical protein [Streptomyces sp. AK02-01A]MDX3855623.1 hypothetical protein [Streptomyces sp. AK02-01A]